MVKCKKLLSIILIITILCITLLPTRMVAYASMLPLEEETVYLILNGKNNKELSCMIVNDMLDMLVDANGNSVTIASDATTVWRYVKANEDGIEFYEEYKIDIDGQIEDNERIDLSYKEGMTSYQLQLIIGKDGQLNKKNKRYIIKVYISDEYSETLNLELYERTSSGNVRVKPIHIDCAKSKYSLTTMEGENKEVDLIVYGHVLENYIYSDSAYLNLTSERVEHPNITTKIYDFDSYRLNALLGFEIFAPITDKILEQDMSSINAGYFLGNSTNDVFIFVVNYYIDDILFDIKMVSILFASGYISYIGEMYLEENGAYTDIVNNISHSDNFETDIWEIEFELKENYVADDEYTFKLDVRGIGAIEQSFNNIIQKAVIGHYDSLEEASEQIDIKESFITDLGYKANYSGNGVDFTIFFSEGIFTDSEIKKLTIKTVEYQDDFREFTDKPIIGEADPWLRVTGAIDSNGKKYNVEESNVYIVENGKSINMDTYYGYGYQTIFIKDVNVDISELKPFIKYANDDRVYAVLPRTTSPVDENHIRDFTEPNQQYTGIIDGNERNYWVTFKKLNNSGSELFVYGPSEREVILDEYFEFKHDILIANIGNDTLEDITVELLDAENVKIDSYWTIGGDGNDMLAAFDSVSSNTQYGEISNIAKIRLLPDGEGEVKGNLIIKAKDQEPVIITLNGKAQNPKIVTEALDEAVKYVPYQHIIGTNNMHDWIETKFSIVKGVLPEGITLNSDTGEIYGVPIVPNGEEEVTYTFTIEAKYLIDGQEDYFQASYKELELIVKPNTNENVYLASDSEDGYYIEQHIGTEIVKYEYVLDIFEDALFVSKGEFWEFKYLWLNGEKLEDGVDFIKDEGSTKITIKSQTFENKIKPNEINTIAMEFRNEDNELHRTSQNFVFKVETSVDIVIAKIDALPSLLNITIYDKREVRLARIAYDALNVSKQRKVTNRKKLFSIENKIARLEGKKVIIKISIVRPLYKF